MNTTWVYLKSTDKDGLVTISEHSCWNPELFAARQNERLTAEGGTCVQITRGEYLVAQPQRSRNP